jgi:hypothetical protein
MLKYLCYIRRLWFAHVRISQHGASPNTPTVSEERHCHKTAHESVNKLLPEFFAPFHKFADLWSLRGILIVLTGFQQMDLIPFNKRFDARSLPIISFITLRTFNTTAGVSESFMRASEAAKNRFEKNSYS